ncbi:MAG: T9SS type A sorting domain-containing protein, partial [Bacteroidia bacterium]|nr:T9SS type A sorting domain-containing protein [Bacteroidia bacterium]
DLNGKLHESALMNLQEGSQTLELGIEELPPGIYLIQLRTTDGEVTSKKLIRM